MTGNPLDVAVEGEGFIAIQTPEGTAYTRDGRMQMLPTGDIVSLNGHPILDASGSPLTADPRGGTLDIARDGRIRQDGRTVGTLGLFAVDLQKSYRRYENAAFLPVTPPEPIQNFNNHGIVQGYVEGSNVNPILEMTRLIEVQRAFEAVSTTLSSVIPLRVRRSRRWVHAPDGGGPPAAIDGFAHRGGSAIFAFRALGWRSALCRIFRRRGCRSVAVAAPRFAGGNRDIARAGTCGSGQARSCDGALQAL